jgi:hypothetical protein
MGFGVNDLVLTADHPYSKTFTFTDHTGAAGDWTQWVVRMQVRHPYDGSLLIELTPLLTVGDDPTVLTLAIPGTLSAKLPKEGVWDILAVLDTDPDIALRLPRPPGRFIVRQGVTRRD